MHIQLYDVFALHGNREFLMRAPMATISAVFKFHKDAAKRVIAELDTGSPISTCHFNGRPPVLNLDAIAISKEKI